MEKSFDSVRHALEEHLSAINENTTEIQALFDYLQEMDLKMEKLTQRLDGMQLSMGESVEKPFVEPLEQTEKDVFLQLYTEDIPLSCAELSLRARIPLAQVSASVTALTQKGVPLLRSKIKDQLFFKLSPSFKELQAKENIVNLSLQSFIQ